jgi:hypothetical protein
MKKRKKFEYSLIHLRNRRLAIKRKLVDLIKLNGTNNSVFFTFTFAEKKYCVREVVKLFQKFRKDFIDYKKSGYVYVIEEHEKGGYHLHGVFFDVPKVEINDIEKKWGGWVWLSRIKNINKVASYIGKYITKGKKVWSANKWYCSVGLKRSQALELAYSVFGFDKVINISRKEKKDVDRLNLAW